MSDAANDGDPLQQFADTLNDLQSQMHDLTVVECLGGSMRREMLAAIWGCRQRLPLRLNPFPPTDAQVLANDA